MATINMYAYYILSGNEHFFLLIDPIDLLAISMIFSANTFGNSFFLKIYLCLPEILKFEIIKMIPAFFW